MKIKNKKVFAKCEKYKDTSLFFVKPLFYWYLQRDISFFK